MLQATLSGIFQRTQCNVPRIVHNIRYCSSTINFDELVKKNKVVVFMKGNPKFPRCGFSNAVTQIFRMHKVDYDAHDVLEDEKLREGIKTYSSWPTIPQVFIDGKFVGGCDILLKMHQNGTLIEELQKVGIKSALLEKEKGKENKTQEKSEK